MSESPAIRVMLVEDDEDVRISTTQVLTLAGFEVESFASVERARGHIRFGVPAIVVCDVRLPGLSGAEWLPELHGIDAELPVILVTGHGHIAMAVQAMREGAYDFIEKPSVPSGWWPSCAMPSSAGSSRCRCARCAMHWKTGTASSRC